jgi:hypothetical protein
VSAQGWSSGLSWVQSESVVIVWHPSRGEVNACPTGRILYEELTQKGRPPQATWVPTGGRFLGFKLEPSLLLLNWQNRYYLLDSLASATDDDIRRDFAPHAKRFGQSDQKAEVLFQYPAGTTWKIDDIGKFRVAEIAGDWSPTPAGATGRFIHASGEGGRALVVHDFEGGGPDSVLRGYRIAEGDIRKL